MASCVKQEPKIVLRGIQSGFCLGGDFIIEFSPQQYETTWHSYRSVARKEFNKTIKVMEIQLGRKKPIDKGKEKIVLDMLNNYHQISTKNNSSIANSQSQLIQQRRFCEAMVRFSQIVDQQTRMLRTVSEIIERNKVASIELGLLREQFLQEVKNTISNDIIKKNEFFFYSISTNNYPAAVIEKSSLGYSAKLMLLLARSLDNFEHSYLKIKSPEIFDQESSQELLQCQINERTSCECNIMTLEGISLRVKVNMQIQCHPGNQIFASKYGLSRELFKDSVVVFYFPQIEQHHLDMLYKSRKMQSSSQNSQMNRNGLNNQINATNNMSQFQKDVKIEYQSQGRSLQNQIKGWGNNSVITQSKNNEILDRYYSSAVIPNANSNNSIQFQAELEKIKLNTLSKQRRNIPTQVVKQQNTFDTINSSSSSSNSNNNQNFNIQSHAIQCKKEQQIEILSFKLQSDNNDCSSMSLQEQSMEMTADARKNITTNQQTCEIAEETESNWVNNQTNGEYIKEEAIDTKIIDESNNDNNNNMVNTEFTSQQVSVAFIEGYKDQMMDEEQEDSTQKDRFKHPS